MTTTVNSKNVTKSMLMIAVTTLSILVLAVNVHPAGALVGLVKPNGSPQPYEPAGPFIDGILVPAYLSNQDNEWAQLKSGGLDVYDWAMRKAQNDELTANICVAAPDVVAGYNPQPGACPAGQAPIQTEIATQNIAALDKFEIDFQNAKFPSNVQQLRWAIAWITDKETFTLPRLLYPDYTTMPCTTLCDPASGQWVDPSLLSPTALANHVYGAGLPIETRIATANAILDAAGFGVGGGGVRVNNRVGCGADPGGCGAVLTPFFYVRSDDPERTDLGRIIKNIMVAPACVGVACTPASGLGIQMIAGCTGNQGGYPYANNYCETTRSQLRNAVFFQFNFNMYTGGWGTGSSPTILDDLYDSRFISAGNTNYVNYFDPVFNTAARQLRAATSTAGAVSAAHAAELEYNNTLPVLDVYTHNAPLAYRIYHSDPDGTLNGRRWEGFQVFKGVGYHNGWSWLNTQLVGAPLHDAAHPVILKYGFKVDVLDSPNPWDSDFVWDAQTFAISHDSLNVQTSDDLSSAGQLPWMATTPPITVTGTCSPTQLSCLVASGAAFPDGSICTPDAPATGCEVLGYELRPDLTFAAALDGSIAAIPVTANDVAFSILLGRDSPTSFVSYLYVHVQGVRVIDSTHFQVEERNQAIWDRGDIGATVVASRQHWCLEAHGSWAAGHPVSDCAPTWSGGYPDAGGNVVGVGAGDSFGSGAPSKVDMGSSPFVYDSVASSAASGPMLFRTRSNTVNTPGDDYFTSVREGASSANSGWEKFHNIGNVNWQRLGAVSDAACLPTPAPDNVINIVDLAVVAAHFGSTPGKPHTCYLKDDTVPWDINGGAAPGSGDGNVNILDLTWVALHFGQTFPPAVGVADID